MHLIFHVNAKDDVCLAVLYFIFFGLRLELVNKRGCSLFIVQSALVHPAPTVLGKSCLIPEHPDKRISTINSTLFNHGNTGKSLKHM